MEQHAVVLDVSRYRPAAGKRDEMLAEMKKIAERANEADGCFGAQICVSNSDKDSLVAVSRWKSRGALEKFSDEVQSIASRDRLAELLDGRAQHEHLTPV
jgi:quinol monooxygenase YgiN